MDTSTKCAAQRLMPKSCLQWMRKTTTRRVVFVKKKSPQFHCVLYFRALLRCSCTGLNVPKPDQGPLTSGASTNVCMNFLMGWPLLDSSPSTCTTTPSLMVACASTCRIFVWHSLNCSDITFLWISWKSKGNRGPVRNRG